MGSQPDNLYIDDKGTGVREFRVSKMERYKVTDWESFNSAPGKGGTRTIAENLTLEQANQIAETYGAAFPGALVNTMEPPWEGGQIIIRSDHPLFEQIFSMMAAGEKSSGVPQ